MYASLVEKLTDLSISIFLWGFRIAVVLVVVGGSILTLAEGIALPVPVRGGALLHAVRESGGTVLAVSEEEIAAGVLHFGRAGFCVEPTSAVVWAGVERLAQQGQLPVEGPVVAVLSGHGLKAAQPISQLLGG